MSSPLHQLLDKKLSEDKEFISQVKFKVVHYDTHEKILEKSNKYPYFCILKSGAARVKLSNDDEQTRVGTIIAELNNNDVFGEFGLFDDSPVTVDIVASTPSDIIQIDRKSFLEHDPLFGYTFSLQIMQDLFKRVKTLNQTVVKLLNFNMELQKKHKSG